MPDNNAAERGMRAIAIGRKNYLFVGSEAGGKAAAIAYTLIETAKLNAIDPHAWLADTLARIPDYKITKVDDLLHAGVNSRGGFFSAADPVEFAEGLSRVLVAINERTASGSNVAANSVALKEETRIFQASFVAGKWTGELASYAISAAGVAATPESASAAAP